MTTNAVSFSPLTPLRFLERSAAVFRTKPAVIADGRRFTYPELLARVRQLAWGLKRAGLNKGDRVAFLSPNTPAMLEAHFGVPVAGGVLVAINTRLNSDEIHYILNHSGAKFLFVDTELTHLIEPIAEDLPSVQQIISIQDVPEGRRLPGPEYEEFLTTGSPDPIEWVLSGEDDPISINYTSGTTGRPKGVMYTHRGAYLNALGEIIETKMTSDSVYLWTLPMFHCNGWCFTWGVTGIGGTHVCLRRVDPARIWELIRAEGVTHFNGAPTVMISLVNHPAAQEGPFPGKVVVTTAGAPPSPTIIGQLEGLGAEVIHVYGLTETYGPYTVCEWQSHWNNESPEEQARLKARQGVPYIISDDVRVVDDEMRDVPADASTLGEVVMRGNNVIAGYFEQPDATAEAFRAGWCHSGDLAVMHPDGYIELRDRKKDIIISGGENISTIEVEQMVAKHPDVLEVAVVAIPDDRWGEVPKAFVMPKPGTNPSEQDIISFCRERMAHFKCPKAVEFLELPKTSTGKVQKFVLREKEWAGHDKRIH